MGFPRVLSRDVARYTPLHSATTNVDIQDITGYPVDITGTKRQLRYKILGGIGLLVASIFITHAGFQAYDIKVAQDVLVSEKNNQLVLIELNKIRIHNEEVMGEIQTVDQLIIGTMLTKEYCSKDGECKIKLNSLKQRKLKLESEIIHG
jgi:hypothetical protein